MDWPECGIGFFGKIDYVRSTLDEENVQQINLFCENGKATYHSTAIHLHCLTKSNESFNFIYRNRNFPNFENLFKNKCVCLFDFELCMHLSLDFVFYVPMHLLINWELKIVFRFLRKALYKLWISSTMKNGLSWIGFGVRVWNGNVQMMIGC